MIIRSYNPIERGHPAIWLENPIRNSTNLALLLRQLRAYPAADGPVDIVIAGGGGSCAIGLEMYVALKEHPRPKRVTILDAPSMSGIIAMSGDHIRIVEGGSIFLHGAGYARDYLLNEVAVTHMPATALRALAQNSEATDALHAAIFARRTGLSIETIMAMRAEETTLNAEQAVRMGFADEVVKFHAQPSSKGEASARELQGPSGRVVPCG